MRIMVGLTLLVCVSCAPPSRCDKADAFVDGLCVVLNGEKLKGKQISASITFTQDSYNAMFDDDLDLPMLLEHHEVSLKYRDWLDTSDSDAKGTTQYSKWTIKHPFSNVDFNKIDMLRDKAQKCYAHMEILGHEMMHFIAEARMHKPFKANKKHNIWGLFDCRDDYNKICDSAEFSMAQMAMEFCSENYGEEFISSR